MPRYRDLIPVAAALAIIVTQAHVPLSGAGQNGANSKGGRTVWDGVYTKAQAERGARLYAASCSACHAANLSGQEMAPALAGSAFLSNWNDLSVGDLSERTRISMPADNPGGLSRQQVVDIVAFILERQSWPPGDSELPTITEALNQVKILAEKP